MLLIRSMRKKIMIQTIQLGDFITIYILMDSNRFHYS
jgi:hypothetical protein